MAFVTNPSVFNITQVSVNKVEGNHTLGFYGRNFTNNDVKGIDIHNATEMVSFPRDIDKFFKNLVLIGIFDSKLSEVTQADLMVFPHLRHLYLSHNRISVIRDNLLKFNPRLEVILLYNNDIVHIDQRTFSELAQLRTLYLGRNYCHLPPSISNARSRNEVAILVAILEKGNCTKDEFIRLVTENPLRVKINELQTENEDLLLAVNQKDHEIQHLKNEVNRQTAMINDMTRENHVLTARVSDLKRKFANVTSVEELVRKKDEEISDLRVKLVQNVKENERLRNERFTGGRKRTQG
jgi:regulator of replication initiation timing